MVIAFFLYKHILDTAPPMAQFDGARVSYREQKRMIVKATIRVANGCVSELPLLCGTGALFINRVKVGFRWLFQFFIIVTIAWTLLIASVSERSERSNSE